MNLPSNGRKTIKICMKWIITLMAFNTIYMLITPKLYARISLLNSRFYIQLPPQPFHLNV